MLFLLVGKKFRNITRAGVLFLLDINMIANVILTL